MDEQNSVIDLALIVRWEQGDSYNIDAVLRRSVDADDRYLATARPLRIDRVSLNAAWPDLQAYGRLLSAQFFADDELRDAWTQARSLADAANGMLRVRLALDPRADDLHSLVWETLTDPRSHRPVAMSERVRFARFIGTAELTPAAARATLAPRALVAVANPSNLSEYSLAPVDVAGEVARMQAAFGDIPADILAEGQPRRASLNQILSALRGRPDLLYLACHGRLVDGQPYLFLEDESGKLARTSGDELIERIAELADRPPLIILGACRSGGDGAQVLTALAPRLVAAGVPAVIGAQGDILMELVADAMPRLIRELRRDGQVDRALAAARSELRQRLDWWRLALWMHTREGQIWAPQTPGPNRMAPIRRSAEDTITCAHLRASFIWAETFSEALHDQPVDPALDLRDRQRAVRTFDSLPVPEGLEISSGVQIFRPWPKRSGQHFWIAYLERNVLSSVNGERAYRQLVPIRIVLPWAVTVDSLEGEVEIEGFCYPHGVACVINLRCTETLSIPALVNLAPMIRRASILRLERAGGFSLHSLDELAELMLGELSRLISGSAASQRSQSDLQPFSVATLLRGTGAAPTLPPEPGGAIHELLEALTRWQIPPAGAALTDLGRAQIPLGTPDLQAGDLLYGHQRGRAVWIPRRFTQQQPSASLGCYHRNLVFAALQIESMSELVRRAANQISAGPPLATERQELVQRAYGILSRMHSGGKDDTYRTLSSQRQIDDNRLTPALNLLRGLFGRPPLHDALG